MRSLAVLAVLLSLLAGCGLIPDKVDETVNWSANRIYSEAHDAMTEGMYDKAIKLFEKLEARYPYGRYSQQAQIETAYAQFKMNEPTSAIASCDRFIRLHPNHPNVDYAYYLKGLASFNEDQGLLGKIGAQDMTERDPKALKESFDAFKSLVTKFPDSKYAPDSAARMNYLVNAMASHEVHVARYYLNRGAYIAAVNRAQDAIKTYPQAPANEEGLVILVKSYDALGMKDLRDDSDRVLRKNFPNSKYLADAKEGEAWWKLW